MVLGNLLAVLAGLLAVPVMMLLVEVLASLAIFRDQLAEHRGVGNATSAAVVVPAHNESSGLLPTLGDLMPQLGPRDRLIVVADNCSDDTAAMATAAGAEVIERNDLSRIGKGYALAHALAHLRQDPPDMVLFVDADCRVQGDMLVRLKDACAYASRPVQACFLMTAPEKSSVDHRPAEFFWLIRNWVRPLGLCGLGLPVQLMGTGMMFPWRLIRDLRMDGNLVEDLKLGLDAAALGFPPCFYPSVVGTSEFPETQGGTETQRQRWIQGHLQMILRHLPRYFLRALVTRNLGLLVLVLDMTVPPFSLLVLLIVLLLFATLAWFLIAGTAVPLILSLINCTAIVFAVLLAWMRYGQQIISLRELAGLAASLPSKVSYYGRVYFGRKVASWIRTDRTKVDQ
ncbi:glycosyltransferase family 2 protein [Bradyrhizobium guangdongense]|uniref:Glycosyl transferase n=1 Tax=Bradyrhizobium guangdongense TaxID=1325090 RepID=A0A410V497_9BRAD|nr:glycosyltransferase [Bradyrhizobium guangdongense]QAU38513.1 glycosyl transferase [Bradyrhizobium guangdongense]QOZ59573.1 glycosyl transferase [Bradyrhizobium guangdongense]GGI33830.1 glycosyl transferase [Bradyrhizobium guangdongense]